jgi:arylsulfatase A-like enzyme
MKCGFDRSTSHLTCIAERLLVAVVVSLFAFHAGAATDPKPNVVVFLVDDMGWQDTSVPFYYSNGLPVVTPLNKKFHTPNMERLASEGMKFTSAYTCSVCTPTRVSLMTGLNAARHKVTNWTLRKDTPTDGKHPTLQPPEWNVNGLSPDPATPRAVCAPTLPQLLRDFGYRTIHVGKAHWGALDTPGADPKNLGFDVNIAGHAAGAPGSYLGGQNYAHVKGEHVWDVPGLESYHGTETFLTEALTIEANKAVEESVHERKPFFLYMAHYAVHVPFAPDKRFYQKYRDAGLDNTEAMYAALVEGMDKSLGDILQHLECLGVASNTVVFFMSDNGGLSAQGRGCAPHTHNAPLSSGKGSAREGGIRVPMIVRWPGVVESGSVCPQPVIIEDFFPSILEVAGVAASMKPSPKVDSRSFVPFLRGNTVSRAVEDRTLYWHYPNVWGPTGPGIEPYSAVRRGDWKLIFYHAGTHFELFNLAEDIGEKTNLFENHKDKAKELTSVLVGWLKETGAQMPIEKSTGKPVRL